jgi:hypothetical protein
MRLFEAYGKEAKAQKLLDRRTFKHASQFDSLPQPKRRHLAKEILLDGTAVTRETLAALGQAKIAYCIHALRLARGHGAQGFASIVPQDAPRPEKSASLRKDYAYLFERFYAFLNSREGDPMGYLVLTKWIRARAMSCSDR